MRLIKNYSSQASHLYVNSFVCSFVYIFRSTVFISRKSVMEMQKVTLGCRVRISLEICSLQDVSCTSRISAPPAPQASLAADFMCFCQTRLSSRREFPAPVALYPLAPVLYHLFDQLMSDPLNYYFRIEKKKKKGFATSVYLLKRSE